MELYDQIPDVVRKAMIGKGMQAEALARATGFSTARMNTFLAGNEGMDDIGQVASLLGLDLSSLEWLPTYRPEVILPDGVTQHPLPFDDEEVNVWTLEHDDTCLVIDAGARPNDLAELLDSRTGTHHLLITHPHRDHIGGIEAAVSQLDSLHGPVDFQGVAPLLPGGEMRIGPFQLQAIDLRGHHPLAIGIIIDGPQLTAIAMGDALFAGSMGGCPTTSAFDQARETLLSAVASLEPDRLILTGHGPATNLTHERVSNPFLAAWLASPD